MNRSKIVISYSFCYKLRLLQSITGRNFGAKGKMGDETRSWRGVPLSEIYGSLSPWGSPEFPLVSPAFDHTVLYHIPSNGMEIGERPPKPQIGQEKWDHDFVRMPCSSQSLYPVECNGTTSLKQRWSIIKEALDKPMEGSQDLAEAILSYNTKFKTVWRFRALHKLFNEYLEEEESQYFFTVTLPEVAKLALSLPKLIQAPIPLLKQHKNQAISLSQLQIASLLANAFFCTFPRRNTFKRNSEYASYPHINFNTLYESSGSEPVLEKLKCLCHYFRRVCTKAPVGVLTFMRRSVPPRQCPAWATSARLVAGTPVQVNASGTIEDDGLGLVQIDFANKYLGGGVLNRGCVQEEIRFVICPELLVSMLFTEVLRPNEAVLMIGCERFSRYTGYGDSFQFAGDYGDPTPLDSSGRKRCVVLAIDALPFSVPSHQYRKDLILRELNKAWVGFSSCVDAQSSSLQYPGVATGNWGCGAFGGSPDLKALLQLMAATEARRPMVYYTFGDVELRNNIINMYNLLATHNVTVGQLYKMIVGFSETDVRKCQLYPFIHQSLIDRERAGAEEPMDTSATSDTPTKGPDNSPDLFSQELDDNVDETPSTNKNVPVDLAAKLQTNVAKFETCDKRSKTPHRMSKFFEGFKQFDDVKTERRKVAPSPTATEAKEKDRRTEATEKRDVPSHRFSLVDEMDKLDQESGFANYSDAKRRKSIFEAEASSGETECSFLEANTVWKGQDKANDESTAADSDRRPLIKAEDNIKSVIVTETKLSTEPITTVQHKTILNIASPEKYEGNEKYSTTVPRNETECFAEQDYVDTKDNEDSLNISVSQDAKKKISKKITDYFNRKT